MKYLPLVWAGLWRKPLRTVFTVLSIFVAFLLFGLLAGLDNTFSHVEQVSRLDRLFSDPKFGAPLPKSYQEQIARVPGVILVAGRDGLFGYYQEPKNGMGIIATDRSFFGARSELTATPAQIDEWDRTRTGIVITVAAAQKYGWKVGDKIPIQSQLAQKNGSKTWTFDIVAICDDADNPGMSGYMLMHYDYLDEARTSKNGTVTRFLIRIDDPSRSAQISAAIDDLFANSSAPTRTNSEKASAQSQLQSLGDIHFLTAAIGASVLFMLLFITGNSVAQSVRERIPEFGVMKTIGFQDIGVFAVVLAESILKFVVAAAAGLAAAKGLIIFMSTKRLPLPPLLLTWETIAVGVAIAVAAGIVSALIPALRVQRLNVVDALAGR